MEKNELKKRISEFAEGEARSCQMDPVTPEYVARVAHVDATFEEIVEAMEELRAEYHGNYYC